MPMMPKTVRIVFLMISAVILLGIYLSGFGQVHWFLYVPMAITAFVGATGICPSYIVLKKMGL